MSQPVCLADYAAAAEARLSPAAWAYLAGGAGDEITLRENRAAFDRLRLAPRILAPMEGASTAIRLFGRELPHPVLLAPVAHQRLFHPMGEIATAQAASALGTPMIVSTLANTRLEDVAPVLRGAPGWFQLYVQHDRGFTRDLLGRAEAAGYQALVVTVDAPVNGVRDRERRAGFALPPGLGALNLEGLAPPPPAPEGALLGGALRDLPGWEDIAWLKAETRLPLLIKGVLSPDDAKWAIALGADGLIVSNHGGRVLDTAPASLDALPAIAAAVGGQVPLLLDGGIRRGTDVVKALALGASAVLLGRPYLHGLALGGAMGVAHVIRLLADEFAVAMALCGCVRPGEIDRRVLFG